LKIKGFEIVNLKLIMNNINNEFPQEFTANLITLNENLSFDFSKSNFKFNSLLKNDIYTEIDGKIGRFSSNYDKKVKF
jgi:hypothetical protein